MSRALVGVISSRVNVHRGSIGQGPLTQLFSRQNVRTTSRLLATKALLMHLLHLKLLGVVLELVLGVIGYLTHRTLYFLPTENRDKLTKEAGA